MKTRNIIIFGIAWGALLLASLSSCSHKKTEKAPLDTVDTMHFIITQIQKCSRLYTAEAHAHRIIAHDDQLNLKGSIFKKDYNIHLPGTSRKVAIPMDATIKAYVDFKDFSAKNVNRKGDKIEIILPDPKLVLTSSKIDHNAIKQYVSITRSNFSDAELSQLEQMGRENIISDTQNLDLTEQAQLSAANTLIPMLKQMGFKEENIKISFRKKFTIGDIKSFFDSSTVEKKASATH